MVHWILGHDHKSPKKPSDSNSLDLTVNVITTIRRSVLTSLSLTDVSLLQSTDVAETLVSVGWGL